MNAKSLKQAVGIVLCVPLAFIFLVSAYYYFPGFMSGAFFVGLAWAGTELIRS